MKKKKPVPKPRAVQAWATMHLATRTISSVEVGYSKDHMKDQCHDEEIVVRVRVVPVE